MGGLNPNWFGFTPNGVLEAYCGRNQTVHFTGSTGFQYLETTEVNIGGGGAFVQFELNTGCSGTPSMFTVELQFANRDGSNGGASSPLTAGGPWSYVLPAQCNAGSGPSCINWTLGEPGYTYNPGSSTPSYGVGWSGGSVFSSQDYSLSYWRTGTWTRVTLPLPATLSGGGRRYRLVVQRFSTSEWGIANLYMGNGCPYGCGGFGLCVRGQCVCDSTAVLSGATCVAAEGLPTELRETFEGSILPTRWLSIGGGSLSTSVTLAASQAMFFSGSTATAMQFSSRRLVTVDMDTRNASYVEFVLYQTTGSSFSQSFVQITLSYSVDGGMTWQLLTTSGSPSVSQPRTQKFSVQLPVGAQRLGTRFQWWQPQPDGSSSSGWVREET